MAYLKFVSTEAEKHFVDEVLKLIEVYKKELLDLQKKQEQGQMKNENTPGS